MRHCVPCGMLLLMLASLAAQAKDVPRPAKPTGADEARGPFKELAGGWVRPAALFDGKTYFPMHRTRDGNVVSPGLKFIAQGASRCLSVGGSPPLVYWNPGPESYHVELGEGKDSGTLGCIPVFARPEFLDRDGLRRAGSVSDRR